MVYEFLPQDENQFKEFNQFNKFVQIELEYEKMAVEEWGSKVADVKNKSGTYRLILMYIRLTEDAHKEFMSKVKRCLAWKKVFQMSNLDLLKT